MIGIIGAMAVEVEKIKNDILDKKTEIISGIEFISGNLYGKNAVVAKCGVGKVFASLCTEIMILKYKPDFIVSTGVAGSLSENIGTLDIVVGKTVVQHDMDTSAVGDPVGMISGINVIHIQTDAVFSRTVEIIAKGMGYNCVNGIVASGDQFVCTEERKKYIIENFNASVCEMEAASIGQVCYVNAIPFVIIRTVSDNADGSSSLDYPVFVKKAAEFSSEIVKNFILSL